MFPSEKKKSAVRLQPSLPEKILRILQDANHPMNYKQIAARLVPIDIGMKEKSQKLLVKFLLRDMAKKKSVKEAGRGKYVVRGRRTGDNSDQCRKADKGQGNFLKSNLKSFIGTVDMTSSGSAFIISEESEQDIYVSPSNMLNAMDGDKVKVRLLRKRNKKPEGIVEEIVERAKTEFVGTVQLSTPSTRGVFLIPDNPKIRFDIHIPVDKINGAANGTKAVARITKWNLHKKNPQGEILRVLGKAGRHDTEMHAILEEFGLPYTFPAAAEKAAEQTSLEISKEEILKRKDFRKITTFTIDPEDAKDFDDALSVQKLSNGLWEIGVHIADVSHYVKENTVLDKEACQRATSVYLVDRVVPMLPEKLSNELCSLRPNEEKLCFSVVFEMDENAKIHNKWFGRTIICSGKRFTYEEVQQIIEKGEGICAKELLLLNRLAQKLRNERFKKGSIAFDKLEVKFHLDEAGNPTGVFFKQMKDSNKLIEDFMLLANRNVAEFMSKGAKDRERETKEKYQPLTIPPFRTESVFQRINHSAFQDGIRLSADQPLPFVYRVHDKPDAEKLKAFAEIALRFGYKINLKNENTIAETMNRTLQQCAGKPEANMIEILAIRTMAKAIYTTKNIGHYGLGFRHYTHFTSPIRRYPDMMVHRLLAQKLQVPSPKSQVNTKFMEDRCKHSSQREKLAADAERASIRYKQVEYLKNKTGEEFEGMISGITEWGIFVELTESHCEGLIRLKDLRDDYYYVDEKNYCLVGRKTKRRHSLGDRVRVEVKHADMIKKQIDFILTE